MCYVSYFRCFMHTVFLLSIPLKSLVFGGGAALTGSDCSEKKPTEVLCIYWVEKK